MDEIVYSRRTLMTPEEVTELSAELDRYFEVPAPQRMKMVKVAAGDATRTEHRKLHKGHRAEGMYGGEE